MYWGETTDQNATHWTTRMSRSKTHAVASQERQEYRLVVYRRAQERFREAMAGGAMTRTAAAWRALQDVCTTYDLAPAEWSLLIHCLMTTTA